MGRLLPAFVALLAALYLLQARSPLRINTDSYRLLAMAVSAYEGHGYVVNGNPDQFPVGYPLVVRTMLQAGLASSMTLVLLNLLGLAVGLWAFYRWSAAQAVSSSAALPLAFVLSSWVMVKHVTLPLTELLYFGLSSLSLFCDWLFRRETGRRKWWFFSAAVVLAYGALQCRSVGLTLFPVLAITALVHKDHYQFLRAAVGHRKQVPVYLGVAVFLSLVALALTSKTAWYETQFGGDGSYFQSLLGSTADAGIVSGLIQNTRHRILEFGEIFANLPRDKFPQLLPIFALAGLVAWMALMRGAWLLLRTRDWLPMPLYFLTYSSLMLVWPYYDSRFWLPLLPVMAILLLHALQDLEDRWPAARFLSRAYLTGFFLFGLVALAFSTRISLSGREFSEVYGEGTTKMTYRYSFQNGKPVDWNRVNEDHVWILRIFEPLARPDEAQGGGRPGVDGVSPATPHGCGGDADRHCQAVRRRAVGRTLPSPQVQRSAGLLGAMGERANLVVARCSPAKTATRAVAAGGSP